MFIALIQAHNGRYSAESFAEKLRWESTFGLAQTGSSLTRRFRHTCVVIEGRKIFAFGGSAGGVLLNDSHILELEEQGDGTESMSAGISGQKPLDNSFSESMVIEDSKGHVEVAIRSLQEALAQERAEKEQMQIRLVQVST
jgi:hypothetical protein